MNLDLTASDDNLNYVITMILQTKKYKQLVWVLVCAHGIHLYLRCPLHFTLQCRNVACRGYNIITKQ